MKMLGKKVKFCTNESHSIGSWGPEILGGRTEEGDGGDKRGHSWKKLCLYPSVLTIWLLSFTRGMLSSGGLRESTGGFGLFLEWPWRMARSERAAAGEV